MGEVKNEILGIAFWIFLTVYFLICSVIAVVATVIGLATKTFTA